MKIKDKIKNIRELEIKIRTVSFGDALYYVLEQYNIKVESLAAKASIDKRNIYRYLNNGVIPKKGALVQLLIALGLSYTISVELLRSAGYALNSSYPDVFYSIMLENPGTLTVAEANELIIEMNESIGRSEIPEFVIN